MPLASPEGGARPGGGRRGHLAAGPRSLLGCQLGDWRCQDQLGSGSFGIVHVYEVPHFPHVRPPEVLTEVLLISAGGT